MLKIRYAKKSGMLKNRYAKKPVWLLDTWAWVHGPWHMGPGSGKCVVPGRGAAAQGHGPMPMCPGAKALAHEYFDIWAHKYF